MGAGYAALFELRWDFGLVFQRFRAAPGWRWIFWRRNFVRPVVPSNNFGSGFGRVVYPGTGRPPVGSGVTFPFATQPTTFVERLAPQSTGGGIHGRRLWLRRI